MKTIACSMLKRLIDNHEPVELLDVRPQSDFKWMHIPAARCFPLSVLSQPAVFRKRTRLSEPVYIVSDDPGRASLAAGILKASQNIDAAVVDGGMEAWIGRGFPVTRERAFLSLPLGLGWGAVVLAIAAGIALALKEIVVAALLLVNAAVLLVKSGFRLIRSTPVVPGLDSGENLLLPERTRPAPAH